MTKYSDASNPLSPRNPPPAIPRLTRRGFLGTTAAAVSVASLAKAADVPEQAVMGYPSQLSVQPGDTLKLHTSTAAATYDVVIERVGAKREAVWSRKGIKGQQHSIPPDASANGCRWPVAFEVPVGKDWRSGYYEVTTTPGSFYFNDQGTKVELQICFVVRAADSGPHAKMLLQLSSNTDNAYNNWGGYSLYAYNGRDGVQGRRASFHRPMDAFSIRRWEIPFIQWVESHGYQIDFAVNNDLEFNPEFLKHYKLVLSVGHDEYWSKPMRDNLEAYVARGGNVAFFSGNVCCWQVRNEHDSLVCYKEYFKEDPTYKPAGPNPSLSTLWSYPLVGRTENSLTNVGVLHGGFHLSHGQLMDGSGAFTVERPKHWVFAGTGVKRGSEFGGAQTVVGYECDGCEFTRQDDLPVPTGRDGTPNEFEILATAPATWGPEATFLWFDHFPQKALGHACLGLSQRPGGGIVFTAGTTDWSHGLAGMPETDAKSDAARKPDPVVERITRNILDRLS